MIIIETDKEGLGQEGNPFIVIIEFGMWSGCQEKASGAERSFQGTWISFRSKSQRSNIQHACCQLSLQGGFYDQ